jgi:hypothetical protein
VIWLADNFFFEQIKFGEDDLSQIFRDAALRDYRLLRIGKVSQACITVPPAFSALC